LRVPPHPLAIALTISSGSFPDTTSIYFRNGAFGKQAAALANVRNSWAGHFLSQPNRSCKDIEGLPQPADSALHSSNRRNRSALLITDTELNVMAALAMMGLSNIPKNG
jgi:hypothetical protein